MPEQRKRFFHEDDKLMVGVGLWHADTQNMSTEHVREATPEEAEAYYTEHPDEVEETEHVDEATGTPTKKRTPKKRSKK